MRCVEWGRVKWGQVGEVVQVEEVEWWERYERWERWESWERRGECEHGCFLQIQLHNVWHSHAMLSSETTEPPAET